MDQQKWLRTQIEEGYRNAKKHLTGNNLGLEIFTTQGRVFSGSFSINDLDTKQKAETVYPDTPGAVILRFSDARNAYEVGLCHGERDGVLIEQERTSTATV